MKNINKNNPCDTCEKINKNNDRMWKRSNYKQIQDDKLFLEAYEKGQVYDCFSCEYNKNIKELYKKRIETRPKFIKLYQKIGEIQPCIISGFKQIYKDLGTEIDFSSSWDYKMFKFYIEKHEKKGEKK